MQQQCYKPVEAAVTPGLVLNTIWDVEADCTYDVHPRRPMNSARVAVRTMRGQGKVFLNDGFELLLKPNTLAVFRICDLQRYKCHDQLWKFSWYEFELSGAPGLPLNVLLTLMIDAGEENADRRLREAMTETAGDAAVATAHFGVLYQRWVSAYRRVAWRHPYGTALDRVIRGMQKRLDGHWSVAEIAEEAGLCERRFRDLFRDHTGKPPKKFYDDLRLEHARQTLQFTALSIGEIADYLGFSSPFHLSRAYRKKYGYPPSRERG